MELFTVDITNNNRREAIIEQYESFIWTDRYSDLGDFQIVANPTADMVARLTPDKYVGLDESDRLMRIDKALLTEDINKKKSLFVSGKSFENIFAARPARKVLSAATWNITGTAGAIIRTMVNDICVTGTGISGSDGIAWLTATDLTGLVTSLTINIEAGSLLERIQQVAKSFDLGFRVTYVPTVPTLAFAVYAGTDRSGIGGVAFSEALDNLSNTSYLTSTENAMNVAYVFAPNGSRTVYATGASTSSGLNRKSILVDASDITLAAGASLNAALDQRGRNVLSEHRNSTLFDGTVNPNVAFKYNRDYFLGDLVSLRGSNGVRQTVRVTEHIWSYDESNGALSFPTLSTIGGV